MKNIHTCKKQSHKRICKGEGSVRIEKEEMSECTVCREEDEKSVMDILLTVFLLYY